MSYQESNFTTATSFALAFAILAADARGHSETPNPVRYQTGELQEPALPSHVTPGDWSLIRDSISTHRHAFEATHAGLETSNPRFDWKAQFDGTSALIRPAAGDWSFGLALKAFGFDGEMQVVQSPRFGTCTEGKQLNYGWSQELSEWWINDNRGFEHGFTVHQRPARRAGINASPLVLDLEVLGSLQPRVNQSRTGLSLHTDAGVSALRYDGLVALDANGTPLSAWLEVDDWSVQICIDEASAEYPILVDPVVQAAYIKASNTGLGDGFSYSVAASGDTVVVGAWLEDSKATGVNGDELNELNGNSGAAYVFVRSGSSWTQQAYLKASNTGIGDRFGYSVAVTGDTVVVATPLEDSNATGIDGNGSNNGAIDSGAAYVFVRSGSIWSQQAYLKASNTEAGERFGQSVAASGDTIVVGAIFEASSATGVDGDQTNNAAPESGAAYIFFRSGTSWTQQAYVKAANTDENDRFGWSVAASGETVVVGAIYERGSSNGANGDPSDNSAIRAGAAYVFDRSGSSWTQTAYLKASNTGAYDRFGYAVSLSGETLVVGAPDESGNATGVNGDQSNNSASDSGAAYVFVRTGSSWSQEAYLKASNTGADDTFGLTVAASGGTIVVGARGEDSSATGVDGDQSDNSFGNAGAAYVFVRSGSSWAQQAYLKASNTDPLDGFGSTVAASSESIFVGTYNERSAATGINGDQLSNTAAWSGALYAFDLPRSVGTPFCVAVANSTGAAGELAGCGSASVPGNDLTLVATGLPPMVFGFFITSTVQGVVMNPGGSEGNLCLVGSIGRYVGPGQIQQADENGSFSLLLDLTATPQPNGATSINVGETWNFQGWHRDTNATGSTSNFTNGLEVLFEM